MMNWRELPNLSKAQWTKILTDAGSPLASVADATYKAALPLTALCLAQTHVESQFGTSFAANPASNHNVLNLRPRGGLPGFQKFATWAEGIEEYRNRLLDVNYAYAHTTTLQDLIHVFAPSSDSNNEGFYVRSIESDLARWGVTPMPTGTVYQIVGLPGPGIELPVPLAHDIISATQTNQRPGIKRHLPGVWVQHETANTAPGADAEMHARWLHNGADGAKLSFHFAVDDGQIIQLIPIDEVTWQAADGNGPGNMSGISCELCVNAGIDTAKSRHNAEALCGGILKALKMSAMDVKRHWDFNAGDPNRHHCPDEMMTENYWPTFVQNVGKIIGGSGSSFAPRMPVPTPLKSKTIDGHPFVRGVGSLTLAKDTEPRQYADASSAVTGRPYAKGRKITPQYITVGADGALWVVEGGSKPGQRFPYSAFVEGK